LFGLPDGVADEETKGVTAATAGEAEGRTAETGARAEAEAAFGCILFDPGALADTPCRKSTAGRAIGVLAAAADKGCPRHCFSSHSTQSVRPSDTGNPQALHFRKLRSIGGTWLWSASIGFGASGLACTAADHISERFAGCSFAGTTIAGSTLTGSTLAGTTIEGTTIAETPTGGMAAGVAATTAGTSAPMADRGRTGMSD
jgi:hypothetical protein